MSLNYIVSAQKPTVVTDSVVGNFIDSKRMHLVLARINRLEVFSIEPEGLKLFSEIPVFGRIVALKSFRTSENAHESLMILTLKPQLAIINWDDTGSLRTVASGSIGDRVGRVADSGILAAIHPSGLMAFRLYDGFFKIIEWSDGGDLRGFNVRCEDQNIIDMNFLSEPPSDKPVLVYLCSDRRGSHLKCAEVNCAAKSLKSPEAIAETIDHESNILISVPQPIGGSLVISRDNISYYKGTDISMTRAICSNFPFPFACYGKIDPNGQRYLIGDLAGRLFMIVLETEIPPNELHAVKDLKCEYLGECSIPYTISYLDNGVTFIGSRFGDSQLIRLSCNPNSTGSYIEILDSYTNLAPIRDMVVQSGDGQHQIITCSGAFKDGSLRVIRNGIGLSDVASAEFDQIRALYSLRLNGSELDNYLLVGTHMQTHFLKVLGEGLDDAEPSGFSFDERTVWAGNLQNGGVLQITISGIFYVLGDLHLTWTAPSRVSVANVNVLSGQVVIACGNILHYLRVTTEIEFIRKFECENEVSCIDISPIGDKIESELIALAYWRDLCIALMSIHDMIEIVKRKIGDERTLARSIMLCSFEDILYYLVGLGDGLLYYFQVDMVNGDLVEEKKATLGTRTLLMKKFHSNGKLNIFACSDRPAVIFSSNRKLVFSNVNVKLITHMTPLNSKCYMDCIAYTDDERLYIGRIDEIQKLHIRTKKLMESPVRIASQPDSKTIAIITHRTEYIDKNGTRLTAESASRTAREFSGGINPVSKSSKTEEREIEMCSVLLMDADTLDVIHCHDMGKNELAMSIRSCLLGNETKSSYYVVGTAIVREDDCEARTGRILIFEVYTLGERTKFRLVHEKEVRGSVYCLESLDGKLVAAINSCVRLFEWAEAKELRMECSDFDNVTALYLRTINDYVLVGDLMRSLSLLQYKPYEGIFQKIARDYMTNWMTSCEIIDKNTFLGAENSFNLFTLMLDPNTTNVEDQMRLMEKSFFHLGELVNVFRHGSLVTPVSDAERPYHNPILLGTNDGTLGLVVQLTEPFFRYLTKLEERVARSVENCLRISHRQYRLFETEKRSEACRGFIDGDLVETVLDMGREQITTLINGLEAWSEVNTKDDAEPRQASVDDVFKIVEELARIH